VYETLLPAYFPRTLQEEEEQVGHLPDGANNIGNEWGTIVYEDRKLRIAAGPGSSARDYMQPAAAKQAPKQAVPVPPINPESVFATKKFTGEGVLPVTWPKPPTMTALTRNNNARRVFSSRRTQEEEEVSEEQRLSKQYEAWLLELKALENSDDTMISDSFIADPLAINFSVSPDQELRNDLQSMEQMNFLNIAGKDMKGRHVVFVTASDISVGSTFRCHYPFIFLVCLVVYYVFVVCRCPQWICVRYVYSS